MSENDIPYNHNRRWYDNINHMTMALHLSRRLPVEIRSLIARNLNATIDEYRKQSRNDKHAVSLGQQRVMGLHKASRRQRWYDVDPGLYRAFNFMSTVSNIYLSEFAARILQITQQLDAQQVQYEHRTRRWMTDAAETILEDQNTHLQDNRDGIKIVNDGQQDGRRSSSPQHPRYNRPQALP